MQTPFNTPPIFNKGTLVVLKPPQSLPRGWRGPTGWRKINGAELQRWYDSPFSKGMDSAGESILPPLYTDIELVEGRVYEVARGRCSVSRGYHKVTGCMELQCYTTGELFFVKREWFITLRTSVQST
jgi:hypothetical protein